MFLENLLIGVKYQKYTLLNNLIQIFFKIYMVLAFKNNYLFIYGTIIFPQHYTFCFF